MKINDVVADELTRNLEMFKWHVKDFSEEELLVRPAPSANHAAWQIGHLTVAEFNLATMCGIGTLAALPAGFADKFNKSTAPNNEGFPSKAQLVEQFEATRHSTIQWMRGLSETDLQKASPERLRRMSNNVADIVVLLATHSAMHIGQIQVIRRKLGKPVLF